MAGAGSKGTRKMKEEEEEEEEEVQMQQQQEDQRQKEKKEGEEKEEQGQSSVVEELERSIDQASIHGEKDDESSGEQARYEQQQQLEQREGVEEGCVVGRRSFDGQSSGQSSELERSIDQASAIHGEEDDDSSGEQVSIHGEKEDDSSGEQARYENASSSSCCFVLPDEVLSIVLSKLPLLHLLRLRSVCKFWKDLISFPLFASYCSYSPPSNYLLTYHDDKLQFFDLESNSWHTLCPPFPLPSSAHILPDPEFLLGSTTTNIRILPSAEGLLCFELNFSGRWIIRVWNVLTDAWRDLPPLPDCDIVAVTHTLHAYLSPDRKTFFIWKFVSWTTAADAQVFMYDSSKDAWAPVQSAEGLDWSVLYRNMGRSMLVMRLKCLAILLSDSSLLQRASLNASVPWECGRMWSEFPLNVPPSFKNADLVHCGGRAFITSWLNNDGNRTLEIWQFDRLEMKWRLIDCMPRDAVEALNTDYVQCLAGNNSLFFIGGAPAVALIYDMSEKQPMWRWVPEEGWLSTATLNDFHIGIFPASLNACNL